LHVSSFGGGNTQLTKRKHKGLNSDNNAMTTIDFFDHVARCNNEGVSLLLAGHDQQAAGAWTLALETAKSELFRARISSASTDESGSVPLGSAPPPNTGSLASLKSLVYSSSSLSSSPFSSPEYLGEYNNSLRTTTMTALINATFVPIPWLESDDFYLYNNAIVISSLTSLPCIEAVGPLYMAIVILNLALLYHRQGRIGRKPICLHKAEKMYDMVIKLISNTSFQDGTSTVVKSAALNNLALIRQESGDFVQAREGLHALSFLLQADKTISRRFFQASTLNGFLLNIFLLLSLSQIAPAA
jgi:hypothetical protein